MKIAIKSNAPDGQETGKIGHAHVEALFALLDKSLRPWLKMNERTLGQAEAEFHARMVFYGAEMFVKENHQKRHENLW